MPDSRVSQSETMSRSACGGPAAAFSFWARNSSVYFTVANLLLKHQHIGRGNVDPNRLLRLPHLPTREERDDLLAL